jgi:hypothetical protein
MYTEFVRKPSGMRPHERPRSRWEGYIKMDHKETGCECMDWIHVAQD